MTNPFVAMFDAMAAPAVFAGVGLSDSATYTSAIDSSVTPCTVMIDRDVQTVGSEGEVIGPNDTATLNLAEVTPTRNSTLTVGTETWRLVKQLTGNESLQKWILE